MLVLLVVKRVNKGGFMLNLCDLPECVDDCVISDFDLRSVERYVVPERMIAYVDNAGLNIGDPGCTLCPCFNV